MDERAQHGYPGHPQQQGGAMAPAPTPWPMPQGSPQYGAPISGHAPHHAPMAPAPHAQPQPPSGYAYQQAPQHHAPQPHLQQQLHPQPQHQPAHQQGHAGPTMQQFQYAANGFVLPGASSAQQPPMSAQGGMIGAAPQQPAPGDAMPMLNAGAAFDPSMQQHQTWAFPTPNGFQMVQGGPPAMHAGPVAGGALAHAPHPSYAPMGHHQQAHAPQLAAIPGAGIAARPMKRRMRWETIVPIAAVLCLCAAIGLLVSDFDRITGRDVAGAEKAASSEPEKAATAAGDGEATSGETADVLAEATKLFKAGEFDTAANLLHPLLDGANPDAKVVALHDRIDAAGARNTALLTRLSTQRRTQQWSGVVATIGLLEQLRPLSPDLVSLRTQATKAAATGRAYARARALATQGRSTQALQVIDAALKGGRNAKLEQLRQDIQRSRATPTTRSSGSSSAPRSGGTGTRGGGSTGSAKPPTSPKGPAAIPPRPDSNPVSGNGSGAAAVTGGGGTGSNCHTHEGVVSCHD